MIITYDSTDYSIDNQEYNYEWDDPHCKSLCYCCKKFKTKN